jgi:hypothetical protein
LTTLLDAQIEFEREFKSVRHDPKADTVLYLYSGGVVGAKDTPPCLCSTPDMAIQLWREAAIQACGRWCLDTEAERAKGHVTGKMADLTWRALPKMLKFQMTMTGKHNQDRVVTDRYAVYSEVAFSL